MIMTNLLAGIAFGAVVGSPIGFVGYRMARRRPIPPIPAVDPLGGPWPVDEAREMLDAWRDQTSG